MVCPENGPFPFSHGSTLVELQDGTLFCAWYAGGREKGDDVAIVGAEMPLGAQTWTEPRVLVDTSGKSEGNPVLFLAPDGVLHLYYQTMYGSGEGSTRPGTGWTTCKIKVITSTDRGATWSDERILTDELGYLTRNRVEVLGDGTWLLPVHDERDWTTRNLRSTTGGTTWELTDRIDCGLGFKEGNIEPALLQLQNGQVLCYMRAGGDGNRAWQSVSGDGGQSWSDPVESRVPNPNAALDLLRLANGHVVMALNPIPEHRYQLSLWLSTDDTKHWRVQRDLEKNTRNASYPSMIQARDGSIHVTYTWVNGGVKHVTLNEAWIWETALVDGEYELANVVPPIRDADDGRASSARGESSLPVVPGRFNEHVRGVTQAAAGATGIVLNADGTITLLADGTPTTLKISDSESVTVTDQVECLGRVWYATDTGLYSASRGGRVVERHPHYGVDGPLATRITALARDSKDVLWVGTPLGLSMLKPDGEWAQICGKDGLPHEDITSIGIDAQDRAWIGTTRGAILYRPYEEGRQWFYRAGERYLPHDHVIDLAVTPEGDKVYVLTPAGVSSIDNWELTLTEKAAILEKRVNERHRRMGMVAACVGTSPDDLSTYHIGDNDNDGLWTSYHIVAMSLAYGATGDEAYRESAKTGMHALYRLQNASGTPGLVARSVVTAEEGREKDKQWEAQKTEWREQGRAVPDDPHGQWRPSPVYPDLYWKSDTSSDEIDGHYFAFYAYYEHIARFDAEEKALCEKQVRDLTDYIIAGNYQLIDYDGERTRWGFWNPENLNDSPRHYLESGLNALQMLSFLKVARHLTGNPTYKEHFDKLITEHGYLSNVLLSKKVFPDMNNHSDNQLGYVAWYPILQLEVDPRVRDALRRGVRRHYKTLARDKSSFFYLVTATIDPDYVDVEGAIENLKEITTDHRQWRMENSHRADVIFDPYVDRFEKRQLISVLPADERNFSKWNSNPYVPDGGGNGSSEETGADWLMAYWIGRYHGLIAGDE
jgi:predicted neuraminidase